MDVLTAFGLFSVTTMVACYAFEDRSHWFILGFAADPYKDYSQPWFGTRKVLRGGCWATSARIARPGYRNFFTPDRCDVFAGFRTCAL